MKFEIKKYKSFKELSEETNAFACEIHADGRKVCCVTNDGHGGCNSTHWTDRAAEAEFTAVAKKMFPAYQYEPEDMLIHALQRENDVRKTLQRWIKAGKKTYYLLLRDDPTKGWRTVLAPFDEKVHAYLLKKYGNDLWVIANYNLEGAVVAECGAHVAEDNRQMENLLAGRPQKA